MIVKLQLELDMDPEDVEVEGCPILVYLKGVRYDGVIITAEED